MNEWLYLFNTLTAKDVLFRPSYYILCANDEITRPSGKLKFEDFRACKLSYFDQTGKRESQEF